MLEAVEVTVRPRGRALLDGVSLTLRPGEITALIGPNGAGKSTLMSVLSGHRRPERGHAALDGRPLARWDALALARRRAVMAQEIALAFGFTVREVVMLGRAPHRGRHGRGADVAVVARAMALAQVAHLAGRRYPSLSGGERQRTMLARALAQVIEPDEGPAGRWLLLDEPTASLDLAHQKLVLEAAVGLARAGCGVVVVLHDLNLAARFADRVAMLSRGRLVAFGTPDEVLSAERVGEVYGVGMTRLELDGRPCLAFV